MPAPNKNQDERQKNLERQKMIGLLARAADSLQEYCANANDDLNDPLAIEINNFLDAITFTVK